MIPEWPHLVTNSCRIAHGCIAVLRALRALAFDIDRLDLFAADRFGVNRTDLRGIERLGARRTTGPTALAAALHVTAAGVTSAIDRVERAGYARRRHDLHDRRKVVVDATDLLIRREQQVFSELVGHFEQLAQTYSNAELPIVQDFLKRSRERVRRGHLSGTKPRTTGARTRPGVHQAMRTSSGSHPLARRSHSGL